MHEGRGRTRNLKNVLSHFISGDNPKDKIEATVFNIG
jgi:hypothetical protein